MPFIVRKFTTERIARAFTLHKQLSTRAHNISLHRPDNNWGIAVGKDYHAVEWQKLAFRIHILECWLKREKINWWHSKYLTNEECEQRTKAQRDYTLVVRF